MLREFDHLLFPFRGRWTTWPPVWFPEVNNKMGNGEVRECSFLFCGFVRIFSYSLRTVEIVMSILGIDFGSDACVIAQAGGMGAALGRGGIDIVLNDNSKRRTPYAS